MCNAPAQTGIARVLGLVRGNCPGSRMRRAGSSGLGCSRGEEEPGAEGQAASSLSHGTRARRAEQVRGRQPGTATVHITGQYTHLIAYGIGCQNPASRHSQMAMHNSGLRTHLQIGSVLLCLRAVLIMPISLFYLSFTGDGAELSFEEGLEEDAALRASSRMSQGPRC